MAAALDRVLHEPGLAARMATASRREGAALLWPVVGATLPFRSSRRSASEGSGRDRDGGTVADSAPLVRLSDEVGIFEHAKLDCPRRECGYCTDDAGRSARHRIPAGPRTPDAPPPGRGGPRLSSSGPAFAAGAGFACDRARRHLAPMIHTADERGAAAPCWALGTWRAGAGAVADLCAAELSCSLVDGSWRDSSASRIRSNTSRRCLRPPPARSSSCTAVPNRAIAARAPVLVSDAADSLPSPGTSDAWPWPSPV